MTAKNDPAYVKRLDELRAQYEGQGYEVVTKPESLQLPFDLGSYSPDLLARKTDGSGGLIVELKAAGARSSVERFQAIAQTVRAHAGWRFLIVSVDDLAVASRDHVLASWDEINVKLSKAQDLLTSGQRDAAVLFLWSIFEGAMRQLAVATATPVERLPASKLMSQLYTLGYISVSELQTAKKFLQLRNQIAHGFRSDDSEDVVQAFTTLLLAWVASWKEEAKQLDSAGSPADEDRLRIDSSKDYELHSWAKKFGVTIEQLHDAVEKVGDSADEVRRYLQSDAR